MKKIGFMDTILRDAHQSLIATRMSTRDMEPALELLDQAGYDSLEVWGGATFDASLRYLKEDPWERLRIIKQQVKNTKLAMLLRGQNVLGYRHYPDDVLDSFVKHAALNGIDVFRVFDALNDLRNMEQSVRSIKTYGGIAELSICYTISDFHTIDYFVDLTRRMLDLEPDRIAIKDMAGILTPAVARQLVTRIKAITDLPLHIHTHCTAGIAEMTYLVSVEAGADLIDTTLSPFSNGTSQPATESLNVALSELGYETGLDSAKLDQLADYFRTVKQKYVTSGLFNPKVMQVEPKALLYQVPGGMLSNLIAQLKSQGQEHLYDAVMAETPKVRADLGYPPLVTPMSQMVGTQALMNVMAGERYLMIPQEIKDYVMGYYGRPPAPISDEMRKKIIGDAEVITARPADLLEPGMEKAREELGAYGHNDEDVLSYALFPQQAMDYFKERAMPFAYAPM